MGCVVTNKELNVLQKERHKLIVDYDKKIINVEEYITKLQDLEKRINEKTRLLIENFNEKRIKEEKMVDEQKTEVNEEAQKKKKGRVIQDSYASLIAKLLAQKSIKDVTTVVEKVDAAKPGRDKKKIEIQIKSIIRQAKKGFGRWKNYTWDDANFQLTEKTE